MSSARNQHDVYLLPLELQSLLLNKPLDQWHRPEGVYVLISEILSNFAVPVVPGIHVLVSESIAVIDSKSLLKFHIGLPLLGRGDVGVVGVIKTLLL
jgi:hypothetical protein